MSILFLGGETSDFTAFKNGTYLSAGDASRYRSTYARAAVTCPGAADLFNTAIGSFTQPSANFWFTAQIGLDITALSSTYRTLLTFSDGGSNRLGLQVNDGRLMRLVRFADGLTQSVFATSSAVTIQGSGLHKLDVRVTYGVAGAIYVYLDQVLVFTCSGDITAGGSTTLDGFTLSSINTGGFGTHWSEVIAIERDTRTLMLKTHTPITTDASSEWVGTQAQIAETIPDDGTVVKTTTVGAVARFGIDKLPTQNMTVRGVKVCARASRGDSGPSAIDLGVTSGGIDTFAADQPVTTGWGDFQATFEKNPGTGNPWTEDEIGGLLIALRTSNEPPPP